MKNRKKTIIIILLILLLIAMPTGIYFGTRSGNKDADNNTAAVDQTEEPMATSGQMTEETKEKTSKTDQPETTGQEETEETERTETADEPEETTMEASSEEEPTAPAKESFVVEKTKVSKHDDGSVTVIISGTDENGEEETIEIVYKDESEYESAKDESLIPESGDIAEITTAGKETTAVVTRTSEETEYETTVKITEEEPTTAEKEAETTKRQEETTPAETTGHSEETKPRETTAKQEETTVKETTRTPETTAKETTKSQEGTTTAHTHNWVAVTTTVHHDAVYDTVSHPEEGHYENTLVKEAYTTRNVISNGWVNIDLDVLICYCGCMEIGLVHDNSVDKYGATGFRSAIYRHQDEGFLRAQEEYKKTNTWDAYLCGGNTNGYITFIRDDEYGAPVQHPAEYAQTWIVDKAAWTEKVLVKAAYDETVITGYKCSGCGATK